MTTDPRQHEVQALRAQIERLQKINASLMDRVERTVDGSGSAFALFEANVVMQETIRERTAELKTVNESLLAEIHERRVAEQLMREARDQATAASSAKSQFLANMSHEMRTPLTAMIGYAEILRDQGSSTDEARVHAETICQNGEHLLALINDILDISRLEAGELTTERNALDPAQIADEVGHLLSAGAAGKGLTLRVEHEWPLPAYMVSDATRIRQVLLNLAGNAVKFTEVGGVTIRVSEVSQGGQACVRFDVIDTGIGIEAEHLDLVFEPFRQADESMARRFGGSGLGLAISGHLAVLMGGTLGASSCPGKGSAFQLTVPVGAEGIERISAPAHGATPKAPANVATPGRLVGLRILLVEDGPDNQRLIRHHLTKAGADVEIAGNGRLGVEAYEGDGPFDVVLMDMQMPEMDGYEAAALLRRRGYVTPIVAVTAHAMAGDRERCLAAGCDDYLTKPIEKAALVAACRAWADRDRAVKDAA